METIRILLVEDDHDDYEFFRMTLESLNGKFNLIWKENGVEALSYLKSDMAKPDIVIMDLNMPLKDGFQTLFEIRTLKDFSHIPVHIFTTSTVHLEKCKNLGCTGYFRKPMHLKDYESTVRNMLTEKYLPKIKTYLGQE